MESKPDSIEDPGPSARPTQVDGAIDAARSAVEALHRASESARLYGTGHASTADSIASATEALVRARGVRIGIAPDGCLLGEHVLPDPHGTLAHFGRRLHGLNLGVIDIGVGIRSGDVAAFLESLTITDLAGEALGLRVVQATEGRIKPIPLRYGDLNLVSGSRGVFGDGDGDGDGLGGAGGTGGPGGSGSSRAAWGQLVQTLTGGEGDKAQSHMAEVAASLNREARQCSETALARLQQQLNGFADSMSSMRVTEQARAMKRLRAFVESLSPKLREALMAISPSQPEVSLTLLVELADVLPTRQVLEALEALDHADRQPSHEAVMLFKKLANLSHRNSDHKNRISQVVDQWRDASILPEDVTSSLQGSIEEIFQQNEVIDFTPVDYQDHLDSLTESPSDDCRSERGEALTEDDVQEHAIRIALEVVRATVDDDSDCRGLLHFLDNATDQLLQRRAFDDVLTAIRAAQRHARVGTEDASPEAKATQTVARAYVDSLQKGPRLRLILTHAWAEDGGVDAAAIRLLRIAGVPGLVASLHHLGDDLPPELQHALIESIGRSLPKHVMRAIASLAHADDEQAQRGVTTFLQGLPAAGVVMLVDQLIEVGDDATARILLNIVGPTRDAWPAPWILIGLQGSSADEREIALGHLPTIAVDERSTVVARMLGETSIQAWSDAELVSLFDVVVDGDDATYAPIVEALRRVCSDKASIANGFADRVANACGGLADRPDIRKAIRRRGGGLKSMFGRKSSGDRQRPDDREVA